MKKKKKKKKKKGEGEGERDEVMSISLSFLSRNNHNGLSYQCTLLTNQLVNEKEKTGNFCAPSFVLLLVSFYCDSFLFSPSPPFFCERLFSFFLSRPLFLSFLMRFVIQSAG
eukprot:TRINITY_DN5098_c4_g1_i1.p2 TRINITY_DN5098_c4_g1~~TRINITY_DN5098_c4_g1_i1.p2  ORF type:complete len:112 (+),score=3.85 TRINITY_DN5098_c4_g1_i1:15-350(+)